MDLGGSGEELVFEDDVDLEEAGMATEEISDMDTLLEEDVEDVPPASETGEKLKAELDDLLDEIDDVLETNAEDFVKSYIQKGGQ